MTEPDTEARDVLTEAWSNFTTALGLAVLVGRFDWLSIIEKHRPIINAAALLAPEPAPDVAISTSDERFNAAAQRVHDRMTSASVVCGGTHVMGYALCQDFAAAALRAALTEPSPAS